MPSCWGYCPVVLGNPEGLWVPHRHGPWLPLVLSHQDWPSSPRPEEAAGSQHLHPVTPSGAWACPGGEAATCSALSCNWTCSLAALGLAELGVRVVMEARVSAWEQLPQVQLLGWRPGGHRWGGTGTGQALQPLRVSRLTCAPPHLHTPLSPVYTALICAHSTLPVHTPTCVHPTPPVHIIHLCIPSPVLPPPYPHIPCLICAHPPHLCIPSHV